MQKMGGQSILQSGKVCSWSNIQILEVEGFCANGQKFARTGRDLVPKMEIVVLKQQIM